MDVDIRQACYADMMPLYRAMGSEEFFAERYEWQKNDRGVLFIAWRGDKPVGDVYLWLEAAEEFLIRQHLPSVPLLTHLEVLPAFRNQGIGTKLIKAVEDHLIEAGCERIALAVRVDNDNAARLYRDLEYRDWGHGEVTCMPYATNEDGCLTAELERCHVMVKELHSSKPSPDRTLLTLAPPGTPN
ncbi:MAG TPA: GNAT family N-acetyltransferase [Pseudonocardiaceae bacterium]|jgi:GNAT superfamily N-acetyltransferase